MRIKHITAKNFKRFTDLTVTDLPETARLVVLVGPNGCGKSSLFEIMNIYTGKHHLGRRFPRKRYSASRPDIDYYRKGYDQKVAGNVSESPKDLVNVIFHGDQPPDMEKAFYVRSAYRHSDISDIRSDQVDEERHLSTRLPSLNSHDEELEANFQLLHARALEELFRGGNRTAHDIVHSLTEPINQALLDIMPELNLKSLENPQSTGGTFWFSKGAVERCSYHNLSSGESAAFDLLLDVIIKQEILPAAVYCIDEPESHIAIGMHGKILEAIYNLTPENSQLWIATHSIGMLRKASEISSNCPDAVVFLDFTGKDFDQPVTLKPKKVDRKFWKLMHEVTLEDLADLIAPDTIILCESGKGFDAKCYNRIFEDEYPNVLFVSVGSKHNLKSALLAFQRSEIKAKLLTLRDRDHMADGEVSDSQTSQARILSLRTIENYLLDDEILESFCQKFDFTDLLSKIKEIKNSAKDLKAAAESIQAFIVHLPEHYPIGETAETFMTYTLAPLITPDKKVYQKLKYEIFGDQ